MGFRNSLLYVVQIVEDVTTEGWTPKAISTTALVSTRALEVSQ